MRKTLQSRCFLKAENWRLKVVRGFTLLEVLIYISLLALLIGGVLEGGYQLAQHAGGTNSMLTVEEEGTFVLRKWEYVLSGMAGAALPGRSVAVITHYDGTHATISLANGAIFVAEGNGEPVPLTTPNVVVDDLQFALIPALGSAPTGIAATATINGIDFSITKYAR